MNKVTFAIVLDKRRKRQDGTYPLKLRINHQRKRYYTYVNIKLKSDGDRVDGLTEKAFKAIYAHPKSKTNSYIIDQYKSILKRAEETLVFVDPFNYGQFIRLLHGNGTSGEVFSLFQNYIDDLKREGRHGTFESYKSSLGSFKKFRSDLKFADITKEFLLAYQKWMIEQEGKTLTTVGIYCRNLRAVMNQARDLRLTKHYPFHNSENPKGYKIPAGRNIKKALDLSEIKKLFEYEPVDDQERFYLDLWLLSYLINGVNMKDMALWKNKNIEADTIRWYRSKTIRTSQANAKLIEAQLGNHSKIIIDRYRNSNTEKESYVLPILTAEITTVEGISRRVSQANKQTRKYIRRIAKKIGIEKNLSMNYSRHSYTTVLINKGHSPAIISDNLGHHSLNTTENYVSSLPTNIRRKQVSDLTDFGDLVNEPSIPYTKVELLERIKELESLLKANEKEIQKTQVSD